MHNTFNINDPNLNNVFGTTTIYVNDDTINNQSGTYTDLADLRNQLDAVFGDELWRWQTIPITDGLNAETRTIVTTLFPNIKYILQQVDYTYNGVYYMSRPTGINGGCSTLYGSGYNTISILSQHTEHGTISFCIWKSEGIAIDGTRTAVGVTVHFYDLKISGGNWRVIDTGGKTYGNNVTYPIIITLPDMDPYLPGGISGPGGGGGTHDNTTDPVPVSTLPSLAATDTKFITLYNPSLTELNSLASWMWSPLCVIEDLQKLWNNPMQGILGLSIVPVQPTRASAPSTIYLGNLESDTTAYKITTQYVTVPMGYVTIDEYWGSYLDYAPYTKIEIFLPYIGTRELNTDDVMGKDVYCYYHVDVLSGACVAQLMCGNTVLYQFAGNCASSVPITGNDWTNVINGVMSVAISTAMVAVGGAVGGAASATAAVSTIGSVAQNIASMKPTVMKSGSLAGGAGFLSQQKPYMIITRPRQALPENQNQYTGYPSWITLPLAGVTGLTHVAEIHLEGIPCTTDEQKEIETLLKNGVIL